MKSCPFKTITAVKMREIHLPIFNRVISILYYVLYEQLSHEKTEESIAV